MINTTRHEGIFPSVSFGNRKVDVIGVGATGSRIALGLAKLGIKKIRIWDPDVVESHNIANQVYGVGDIGEKKVKALARIMREMTGTEPEALDVAVKGGEALSSVVFLLTDSMESRKAIWEGSLKWKPNVNVVIETRMGVDSGRVYLFCPTNPIHIRNWENTLCEDEEAVVSACGGRQSVGPTASLVEGYALWQLVRWFNETVVKKSGDNSSKTSNEIIFSTNPFALIERVFE